MMNSKTVLVVVNDIFFYTKLRDALLPQGFTLERARVLEEVPSKAATVRPAAVILDMNDEKVDAFRALEQARESAGLSGVPILAFANHEEVATWQRARELGVSKIVSRNEFSSRTRELVAELISHQPSAVSQAES